MFVSVTMQHVQDEALPSLETAGIVDEWVDVHVCEFR